MRIKKKLKFKNGEIKISVKFLECSKADKTVLKELCAFMNLNGIRTFQDGLMRALKGFLSTK